MRRFAAVVFAGSFLVFSGSAAATPPNAPTITEPSADGAVLNPADVHMEAANFLDADGQAHVCSDWQIWSVSPSEPAWEAPCANGVLKVHIHLGDGTFVNSHASRTELNFDTAYRLRVRFRDSAGELSGWSERPFSTSPAGPPGEPSAVPWAVRQPDFKVEIVAGGFQLPVNIAMVPQLGSQPSDPFLYVSELYGTIKLVSRDGTVTDYATGLLNFNPTGNFPGSGEQGLTGIAVDPASGDVFASLVYEDTASMESPKPHYAKVVRLHSNDGGRTAATQTTILDMAGETQGPSHQISNVTIGPDGKLYVHNGDGFETATARNLNSFRGKVLRMNFDGSPAVGNPFYNASDGITARDYIFAYGFRNPFGGAWRAADGSHYEVENGPSRDRFAQVVSGRDYGWNGTDSSMENFALYNWFPAHAPVNIAFVEPETAFGSGFPEEKMSHAFVTESGSTWATGPPDGETLRGKSIVEFVPGADGTFNGSEPVPLVEYSGTGKATAAGLAAGPDGLYFTDLYKDLGATNATDRGANLLRVRYVPPHYARPASATPMIVSLVPTFRQCGVVANPADGRHAAPLSGNSCNPPVPVSSLVRIGPQSTGSLTIHALPGDQDPGNGDQADFYVLAHLSDVQTLAGGDYNPNASGADLTARARMRITDVRSGPAENDPGTTTDFAFSVPLDCTSTVDTAVGADCGVFTTADALSPGYISEGKQTVVQVFRVHVTDPGLNGVRGDADDRIFAHQGYYVP